MNEKTIKSEHIYSGRIIDVRVDTVEGPNGQTTREIVDHAHAVTIIPFQAPDIVYLVHQFRKPVEQVLIEAPAGCIEKDEDPNIAAIRELKEETGFHNGQLKKVGEMYMAPGFTNEYMHYYIATNFMEGNTNFDSDETMELRPYKLSDAFDMIKKREIIDAKTIMGLYFLNESLH
tara:strand:- start:3990 stop:4514 length:525 start_codon:yes stop_codon:yes gene_type:complete